MGACRLYTMGADLGFGQNKVEFELNMFLLLGGLAGTGSSFEAFSGLRLSVARCFIPSYHIHTVGFGCRFSVGLGWAWLGALRSLLFPGGFGCHFCSGYDIYSMLLIPPF
jgi:hypothetical protein